MVVRTGVFGYDSKKLRGLKLLGYKIGASLPGTVSLDGKRYDYHILYTGLSDRYGLSVGRKYAKPGLYPTVEVERSKNTKLRVRGYRREDRPILDKFVAHEMVIRGILSGVFGGLYPWVPGQYQERVDAGLLFPIVCEDESTCEAVGNLDLWKSTADVMQHTMKLGMFVRWEYQGIGVGTMLMSAMKVLAKRLHLARVWLSVFDGNVPAQKLYRKSGFDECGKIPGWLRKAMWTRYSWCSSLTRSAKLPGFSAVRKMCTPASRMKTPASSFCSLDGHHMSRELVSPLSAGLTKALHQHSMRVGCILEVLGPLSLDRKESSFTC